MYSYLIRTIKKDGRKWGERGSHGERRKVLIQKNFLPKTCESFSFFQQPGEVCMYMEEEKFEEAKGVTVESRGDCE